MRKFGFIIAMCQTHKFLVHNKVKVRLQGGNSERITKAVFARNMAKDMV